MERKLIRFTAIFTCAFSLFACAAVFFLPALERGVETFGARILRNRQEREERYALLEQMSGLEIMDYNTQKAKEEAQEGTQESEQIGFTQQMRLELPEGVKGGDVSIREDYMEKQIEIWIPDADKYYIYDYPMMGKSDGIEDLDYTSGDGGGTVVLTMSNVAVPESSYDETYLYLDFVSPREAYDHVVVIDAGHGGNAPGATSGTYYEKDITLAIVQKIKELFDAAGDESLCVYYTRLADENPDFDKRIGIANEAGADLFLSVHINSLSGNTSVEGTEVLYDELAEDTAFDTREFAQICLEEEVAALRSKDMGLVEGNWTYVIRNAQMPAALVEVGFMNNPDELEKMLDDGYQQKAAQGIYNAVMRSLAEQDKAKE